MTSDEKKQLQNLAAKYEPYGYTFVGLLRMISDAPKDYSFSRTINALRASLGVKHGEPEYYTIDEVAELVGDTKEELIKRINVNFKMIS